MTDSRPSLARRAAYGLTGLLAAFAGLAAGHLVAAWVNPAASPVLAVGSSVIDLTPTPVKEFAIRTFGTADKAILLTTVGLVVAAVAILAGVLSRRRPSVGVVITLGLAVVAGIAALSRPTAAPADAFPAIMAGVVGVAVLRWLTGRLDAPAQPEEALPHPADVPQPPTHLWPPVSDSSRRRFLTGAVAVTAGAAVVGVTGQRLSGGSTGPSTVSLPVAADAAAPLPASLNTAVPGISPFRTPNADFYRVDTNLIVPRVDVKGWKLTIDGDVEKPFTLTFAELIAMPLIERDITMTCVSNEVGGPYIGSATWRGVRLTDLLDRAGVGGGADQILSTAVDGFTLSTPLAVATDGRDAMVAVGMNGVPLPATHGFPARLITPGLYGFVGGTKWLTKLTLTTYAKQEAYWTQRGWALDGTIKTSARVDTPRPLSTIPAGTTAIGGVAWAQHRGVGVVEVSVDGGSWQPARLGPDAGIDYWRQWYLPWDATAGRHTIAVRATDLQGEVQTDVRVPPYPAGSSGIQEIVVIVK